MSHCKKIEVKKINVKKKSIIIFALIIVLIIWIIWGNMSVKLTNIRISAVNLPTAFAGYKIAQISDLHNAEFGNDNEVLISLLKSTSPDIIAITGDIVDSNHTDIHMAIEFINNMKE